MDYNIKLIKKDDYTPTFWSGGMATEIITYPLGSTYAERNFLWRLGFAKIDILESTFSTLPNVSRHLMVTDGKMIITHENRYSKTLNPFDQDNFMGDWNTKTKGKCSVFNLMTRENYDGELIHLSIEPKNKFNFKYNISEHKNLIAICFHSLFGTLKTNINNKEIEISTADLLCINYDNPTFPNNTNICNNYNLNCEFVFFNASEETAQIIVSVIYTNLS